MKVFLKLLATAGIIGAIIAGLFALINTVLTNQPKYDELNFNKTQAAISLGTSQAIMQETQTKAAYTPPPTATALIPSSTFTPLITVTPNSPPTRSPAPPTATLSGFVITIRRSPDTIAVCTNQPANLRSLQVKVGQNENYPFATIFPDSSTSQNTSCLCLARSESQAASNPYCSNAIISVQANADAVAWRNDTIFVSLDNTQLGECRAQPLEQNLYDCGNLNVAER